MFKKSKLSIMCVRCVPLSVCSFCCGGVASLSAGFCFEKLWSCCVDSGKFVHSFTNDIICCGSVGLIGRKIIVW